MAERTLWRRWRSPSPTPCEPSLYTFCDYERDLGAEVAKTAALAGYRLVPWQAERLRDWSAYRPGGGWVHRTVGDSVPRQQGKSVDGIAWTVFLASVMGYKVLWTDHNYSTTCEMLRRFKAIYGSRPGDPLAVPSFNKGVRAFSSQTSQERFDMRNGGMIAFSTRTKTASLGFSFDVIVFDEAQELTDAQAQALIPTTTSGAKQNPQLIYLGTPTRAGSAADKFADLRKRAIAGGEEDFTWMEFGTDDPGDVDRPERWTLYLPSLGDVATPEAVKLGMKGMSPLAAAQEYLGYWLPEAGLGELALDADKWDECEVSKERAAEFVGKTAMGVKFSPDGTECAVSAAVLGPEGRAHLELVQIGDTSAGVAALAAWLCERQGKVAAVLIDGRTGAQTLYEEMLARGYPERGAGVAKVADAVAAAARLMSEVNALTVTHIASPALDVSAKGSVRRKIGESGSGFGDGAEAPSLPVESAALALQALRTTKRDPARKMRAI